MVSNMTAMANKTAGNLKGMMGNIGDKVNNTISNISEFANNTLSNMTAFDKMLGDKANNTVSNITAALGVVQDVVPVISTAV